MLSLTVLADLGSSLLFPAFPLPVPAVRHGSCSVSSWPRRLTEGKSEGQRQLNVGIASYDWGRGSSY